MAVNYFDKGVVYDFDDFKHLMIFTYPNLYYNEESNGIDGEITIKLRDFPLFDVYECFGDFIGDIIDDLEEKETIKIEG